MEFPEKQETVSVKLFTCSICVKWRCFFKARPTDLGTGRLWRSAFQTPTWSPTVNGCVCGFTGQWWSTVVRGCDHEPHGTKMFKTFWTKDQVHVKLMFLGAGCKRIIIYMCVCAFNRSHVSMPVSRLNSYTSSSPCFQERASWWKVFARISGCVNHLFFSPLGSRPA